LVEECLPFITWDQSRLHCGLRYDQNPPSQTRIAALVPPRLI
jgi:hypothetical protein